MRRIIFFILTFVAIVRQYAILEVAVNHREFRDVQVFELARICNLL